MVCQQASAKAPAPLFPSHFSSISNPTQTRACTSRWPSTVTGLNGSASDTCRMGQRAGKHLWG